MRFYLLAAVLIAAAVAWAHGYGPAVVAAAVAATVVWARAKARTRAGVAGHSHGGSRARVARHEAGHVVAARAEGGRVLSAKVHPGGGGWVDWDMSDRPLEDEVRSNVTFLRAGEYADPIGCGGDRRRVSRELRRLPAADRSRVRAEAEGRARRIVSSRSGEIRQVAERLNRDGRL